MNETSDYLTTPTLYIHCLRTDCPRASQCLRQFAGRQVNPKLSYIRCINPSTYPADADQCPHFQPIRTIRLAWGIAHVGNDLPYEKAVSIKRALHQYFSKITYYRISHHERPLSPKEQNDIQAIFQRHAVNTPPKYDYFTTEYDWEA